MEPTSQAAATAPQVSSATPTAVAPSSASQYATSAPSTSQVSQTMAPSGLGESGTPGLSPGTGPAGFGGGPLGGQSVAGGVSSPIRKPEYVVSLPDPGTVLGTGDADVSSQYPGAMGFSSPSSVGPAGSPDLLSASFNPNLRGPNTTGSQPRPRKAHKAQALSDSYLSQISDQSLEVLEHFGAEAPALLNNYACAVEDALIEQVQRGQHMDVILNAAGEERAAMNLMLTRS